VAAGIDALCDDLSAEHDALDALVAPLDSARWDVPTPATGWRIRDQIGHLTYYDRMGYLSATDPEGFARDVELVMTDPAAYIEQTSRLGRDTPADELLEMWRAGRAAMLAVLRDLAPDARLAWYGPPMSGLSFATARLMETWAHGTDVADALGAALPATARLRHIAHLGVRTRGWSYVVRGDEPPDDDVYVALTAPSGEQWEWGDPSAAARVTGPALDFCLVVTQRRRVAGTALVAEGDAAAGWLAIAQAFAGGATRTPVDRAGLPVGALP
jgi:uncharacterized protein (TIGR03084 family)